MFNNSSPCLPVAVVAFLTIVIAFPQIVLGQKEGGDAIDFRFSHPEFVANSLEIDPRQAGIQHSMEAGCMALFSAVDGNDTSIEKFGVMMAGAGNQAEWLLKAGEIRTRSIPDGAWQTMLVSLDEDKVPLFSGVLPARFAKGRPVTIRGIKLTRGLRLTGKLADVVPRPVNHGRVVAHCLHKPRGQASGDEDPSLTWSDVTEIKEDGSFTFESLPTTGTIQLLAVCRGWLNETEPRDGNNGGFVQGIQINLANADAVDNQLAVELPMQQAGSIEVQVTKPDGTPLSGAQVATWPNQMLDKSGSNILGEGLPATEIIKSLMDGTKFDYAKWYQDQMKDSPYNSVTDEQGRAVLYDIPIGEQQSLALEHADYRLKTNDERPRAYASVSYTIKDTQRATIKLETVPLEK